jgi:NADH dehydrogenase [ubiquinone] 1 alpha subcomplex assembly factor 5
MNKIFNINTLINHRNRAIKYFPKYDYLFEYASDNIIEKLLINKKSFKRIIEIGSRSLTLTNKIEKIFLESEITICDNSDQILSIEQEKYKKYLIENELILLEPNSYDLVLSSLYIHWINNLPILLENIKNLMGNQSFAIIAFIGGNSLNNLKRFFIENEISLNIPTTPHISPFLTKESILQLCKDMKMKNIIIDTENIEVEYKTCYDLMKELNLMGESNCLISSEPYSISKKMLNNAKNSTKFIENFEIIYCSYFKN